MAGSPRGDGGGGGVFVKGVSQILQQVETGLWQDPHAGTGVGGGGVSSLKVYHRYYSKWRQVYGRIHTRRWGGGGVFVKGVSQILQQVETGLWQDPHAGIGVGWGGGGVFVKGVSEILQQVETGLWQDPRAGIGWGGGGLR